MTLEFKTSYTQALVGAGLSEDQAHLYQILLQKGSLQAGRVPRLMEVSRPQAYKLLQELLDMGIATKEDLPGKPARYSPAHPFAVQELLRKRKEELEISSQTVQGIMGSLISEFTAASQLPGIRIISGIEGVRALFADILEEKTDISIIRSVNDDDSAELRTMIFEQIKKQVAQNIHVRTIGPLPTYLPLEQLLAQDVERLVTRRVMPRDTFSLPAQIILYNNKVGITSYKEPFITTIIENEAIALTMKALFETVWGVAEEPKETNQ